MKRVIPFAAALLMAGTIFFINPGLAYAWGFSNAVLCDTESSQLCLNGYDGNGSLVKGFPYTPGNAQDISETLATGECNNGLVTETCPFYLGSGLNSKFVNKPIVTLQNNANQMLYYTDESGLVLRESLNAFGNVTFFVQDGNISSGASATFISVDISNFEHNSDPWGLATAGNGAAIQVVDTVNFSPSSADHFTKRSA